MMREVNSLTCTEKRKIKESAAVMLSNQTIEIIKSTVPVLQLHGVAITTRFYERLFSDHPELLHIFNHANQKQGRQQAALSNAVYAAAAHIDQLEAILPAVKQIAHKHRSLGVKAEHYPIVGKNLLLAIKDVLGDAATDEIIQAWSEAYGAIAEVFIQVEQDMYDEAERQHGGWEGFRRFVVAKKVKESEVITSFYLKPEDDKALSDYQAGQYITIKVDDNGDYTQLRQYSLSDRSGKDYYRISVKREDALQNKPEGQVSNYLHRQVGEGDVIQVSAPAGDFVLDTSKGDPLVLISGGVGITPMAAMLHAAAERQPERQVIFVHAAINSRYHALQREVADVAAANPNIKAYICYEAPTVEDQAKRNFDKQGYVDLAWLQSVVPSKLAEFYFCGPVPFMKAINYALKEWGVADEAIHYEFFGPKGDLEISDERQLQYR